MKMSWQAETDRLECHWDEFGQQVEYKAPWIQEASQDVQGRRVAPPVPFTKLSSFGGGQWFAPYSHSSARNN